MRKMMELLWALGRNDQRPPPTSSQLWLGVEHLCSKLLVVANRRRTWCLVAFTCLLLWVRVFTIAGGYNLVHSEYVHALALSALGTLIKSALRQVV